MKYFIMIVMVLGVTACGNVPERVEYKTVESKPYSSWEDLFDNSQNVEVTIFNTGFINIPAGGIIDLEHENVPEFDDKIWVAVPIFYVENSNGTNSLIDTGLNRDYDKDRFGGVAGLIKRFILPPGMDGNNAIDDVTSLNIDTILFTHMHFDHTAALLDFDEYPRILVGQGEKPISVPLLYRDRHFDRVDQIEEINFDKGFALYPFESVVDIYGDGSIFAISTSGHTDGHVSYLINCETGPKLVTGDMVNMYENIEYDVPPGDYCSDKDMAAENFDLIMEFLTLNPNVEALVGHPME